MQIRENFPATDPKFQHVGFWIYRQSLDNLVDEKLEATATRLNKIVTYELPIQEGETWFWRKVAWFPYENRYQILKTKKVVRQNQQDLTYEFSWDQTVLPKEESDRLKEQPFFKPVELKTPTSNESPEIADSAPELIKARNSSPASPNPERATAFVTQERDPNNALQTEIATPELQELSKTDLIYQPRLLKVERFGIDAIRISAFWEVALTDPRFAGFRSFPFTFDKRVLVSADNNFQQTLTRPNGLAQEKTVHKLSGLEPGTYTVQLLLEGATTSALTVVVSYQQTERIVTI